MLCGAAVYVRRGILQPPCCLCDYAGEVSVIFSCCCFWVSANGKEAYLLTIHPRSDPAARSTVSHTDRAVHSTEERLDTVRLDRARWGMVRLDKSHWNRTVSYTHLDMAGNEILHLDLEETV